MRPFLAAIPPLFGLLVLGACSESSVRDLSPEPDVIPDDTDTVVDPGTLPIPVASAPLYAQTSGELFEVDPANGDITSLGLFRTESGEEVTGMVDIAIDLEGRLFGGTFDVLYQIDPETAEAVPRCDWQGEPPFALAFTSAGELVAGAGSEIRVIDVDTCSDRVLVDSRDYETSGDLVGLPDGYLYWSVRGERDERDAPDELVRIDPSSGRAEWIGVIGFTRLFGMAFFDDELYGFADNGNMVRIAPDSGNSFLVVAAADKRWYGATTNPVLWD